MGPRRGTRRPVITQQINGHDEPRVRKKEPCRDGCEGCARPLCQPARASVLLRAPSSLVSNADPLLVTAARRTAGTRGKDEPKLFRRSLARARAGKLRVSRRLMIAWSRRQKEKLSGSHRSAGVSPPNSSRGDDEGPNEKTRGVILLVQENRARSESIRKLTLNLLRIRMENFTVSSSRLSAFLSRSSLLYALRASWQDVTRHGGIGLHLTYCFKDNVITAASANSRIGDGDGSAIKVEIICFRRPRFLTKAPRKMSFCSRYTFTKLPDDSALFVEQTRQIIQIRDGRNETVPQGRCVF